MQETKEGIKEIWTIGNTYYEVKKLRNAFFKIIFI
jgi:hypothetical protein